MKYKSTIFAAALLCLTSMVSAQDTLRCSLKDCREMALSLTHSGKAQQELLKAAEYNRKATFAAMFPRVSANGGYRWVSKNAHMLADEKAFGQGTAYAGNGGSFQWNDNSFLSQLAQQTAGTIFQQPILDLQNGIGSALGQAYQKAYDVLTIDVEHVLVAQVGVLQPIYVGGRLIQIHKIAKSVENIAKLRSSAKNEELIVAVDEAYWRVVSVAQKKQLAEEYYQLLCRLENDVRAAVEEGVATQSDLLKVCTKRGDAEVKKLQAENGLTLSSMALAQACGLPLMTQFVLDESGLTETMLTNNSLDAAGATNGRSEIQMLEEAEKIARSNAKLASAGLQPNIIASASYAYTNPSVENGVRSDWSGKGFFMAGVTVNIPIAHADAILRYKAARHAANAATLTVEEMREKLTLQTTQANQRLMEAQQKIAMAQLNKENAAEVLRMAQESFDAGMITASELMMAQTNWLSAATELVDAQVEAKNHETHLRKYTGKL